MIAANGRAGRARRLRALLSKAVTGTTCIGRISCGVLLAIGASTWTTPSLADGIVLPPGPGRELVYGQCRTCHDLQYLVESKGVSRDTWSELLDSMRQYGLRVSDDQRARILDYLATYLGPNPPPAGAPTASPAKATVADGAAIFRDQCAACHQPDGQGLAGQFPPLANNPDLFLSHDYPAGVVLFGLSGKIEVANHSYDGLMPPLNVLGDAEIAAVLNYVRGAWGNDRLQPKAMPPLDEQTVAGLRAAGGSPTANAATRARLKAGVAGSRSTP